MDETTNGAGTAAAGAPKPRRERRGHGEGSIFQRRDGRWVGVVDLGWAGGKRRRKHVYGKTQAEVRRRLTAAAAARDRNEALPNERTTVGKYLDRWLEDVARPRVRPSTYRGYGDIVRLHLKPELGHLPLAKLSASAITSMLNRKAEQGLSPRMRQMILVVLRMALKQAKRWRLVADNAALDVDAPRQVRHEVRPLSPEQARTLIESIAGHRLEAVFVLALSTGMRLGEIAGLGWADVDLDGRRLVVQKTLQRVKGKGLQLLDTKTDRSRRTLALRDETVAALRAHRARQAAERLAAGALWRDSGQVFATRRGALLDPREIQDAFKGVLDAAKLPAQRFHDLRHACASYAIAEGASLKDVQELLGHSTIVLMRR